MKDENSTNKLAPTLQTQPSSAKPNANQSTLDFNLLDKVLVDHGSAG